MCKMIANMKFVRKFTNETNITGEHKYKKNADKCILVKDTHKPKTNI